MQIVVIGGSGHVGSFLVPRLIEAGHDVTSITRGLATPYLPHDARVVILDRAQEEEHGTFGNRVRDLGTEVVIDLICYQPQSAQMLVDALRGHARHLLVAGSIWRHGPAHSQPITEDGGTPPEGEYGIAKAQIDALLKEANGELITTSIHPGQVVGPGWMPIGPLAHRNPAMWWALSAGEEIFIPGFGAETMHHVHGDDVAQAFLRAIDNPDLSAGEDFNIVAPDAMTVRGYATAAARWFGQEAHLTSVSWERFRELNDEKDFNSSWEHLRRSHVVSTEKARRVLGYAPRYSSEAALLESVRWLNEHNQLKVARPLLV